VRREPALRQGRATGINNFRERGRCARGGDPGPGTHMIQIVRKGRREQTQKEGGIIRRAKEEGRK